MSNTNTNITENLLKRSFPDFVNTNGRSIDLYGIVELTKEECSEQLNSNDESMEKYFNRLLTRRSDLMSKWLATRLVLEILCDPKYRELFDHNGFISDILQNKKKTSASANKSASGSLSFESDDIPILVDNVFDQSDTEAVSDQLEATEHDDDNGDDDYESIKGYQAKNDSEQTGNILTSVFSCGGLMMGTDESQTPNSTVENSIGGGIRTHISDTISAYNAALDNVIQNVYSETMETLSDFQKTIGDVTNAFTVSEEDIGNVANVIAAQESSADGLCGSLDGFDSVTDKEFYIKSHNAVDTEGMVTIEEEEELNETMPIDSTSHWEEHITPPRKGNHKARIITPDKVSNRKSVPRKMRKVYEVHDFTSDGSSFYDINGDPDEEQNYQEVSLLQKSLQSVRIVGKQKDTKNTLL